MPIYEYACPACGAEMEKLLRSQDQEPSECPECGQPGLKRKVSAAVFRLSGSGWYETDFKKDGRRHIAGGGADAPEKEKSASGKKGEGEGKSKESAKPGAGKKESKPNPNKAASGNAS
ncbi:MAG: zinc ribbon domain-containing protein [Salinisphaera sp.]|nr:zinc ribbon domain-containing protein [Salinisphaera sp.]